MAAGLSLRREHLEPFRQAFDEEVRRHLAPEDLARVVLTDGELAPDELTLEVAEALRTGGPWGQGFPPPVFDGIFRVLSRRTVGDGHLKLMLRPRHGQCAVNAIAFRFDQALPDQDSHLRIAYRLDVNQYQGLCSPQLVLEHLEPAQGEFALRDNLLNHG
jgi:single-stranded-DNA-specific exonuclease